MFRSDILKPVTFTRRVRVNERRVGSLAELPCFPHPRRKTLILFYNRKTKDPFAFPQKAGRANKIIWLILMENQYEIEHKTG